MAVILRYLTDIGSFGANYVKLVQAILTLSAKNVAQKTTFR